MNQEFRKEGIDSCFSAFLIQKLTLRSRFAPLRKTLSQLGQSFQSILRGAGVNRHCDSTSGSDGVRLMLAGKQRGCRIGDDDVS